MTDNNRFLKDYNVTNLLIKGPLSFALLGAWNSKVGPVVENIWYPRKSNTDSLNNVSELSETPINITDTSLHNIEPTKGNINFILTTMLNGGEEPSLIDESSKSTFFCQPNEQLEHDKSIRIKFLVVERYTIVMHSFLFSAACICENSNKSAGNIIPHCLVFVFSLVMKEKCRKWFSVLNESLKKYIPYFRISHKKNERDSIITDYTGIITDLIRLLYRLDTFALDRHICFKKTFFSTSNTINGDRIKRDFLSTAIMSHLMTFGRSLVIGSDINLINTMIRTLAVFLPEDKRELCMELREEEQFMFSSQIMIQGYCEDSFIGVDCTPWQVITGSYPLTIVYINAERVLQSGNYTQHLWMQNILHQKLLTKLYFQEKSQPIVLFLRSIDIKLELILKDGCYLGDLCKTLVTKMLNVPGCRKKSDIFRFFEETLIQKAKLLILLTQQHSRYKKNVLGGEWRVSKSLLRDACQLKKEGDFLIVLTCAEQLCPGIYGMLCECSNEHIVDINIVFDQI